MRLPHLALLLASSLQFPGVLGWGAAGHEIIATIAQIHLDPSVYLSMCTVLNFTSHDPNEPPCHLAPIAAWADKIRYKMRWSASLHYIGALDDYPSQTCEFPGQRGWAGRKGINVLGGVRNVTNILEDWVDNEARSASRDDTANEALKFLVHFMGDLHMPLHLTGRDRGGNSNKVRFGRRVTNLHSLWDGLLIAKAIRETPPKYSHPLPYPQIEFALRDTIYDSYVRRIMWEGVLHKWADEIPGWVSCPADRAASPPDSFWQQVMTVWNRVTRGSGIADDTDDELICPYHWAAPIHALNCEIVWPKALDEPPYRHSVPPHTSAHDPLSSHGCGEHDFEIADGPGPYLDLDTPEYAGVIAEQLIVEKLLAQGGIRLAAIINWLFADIDGNGSRYQKLKVLEHKL